VFITVIRTLNIKQRKTGIAFKYGKEGEVNREGLVSEANASLIR
jgi:hypothetical protein